MSPYHVQIDSLYFHVIMGLLLKGKQISSLQLPLQKHKMYDLKKSIPPIQWGSWISSSPIFCLYQNEEGSGRGLIRTDIDLVEI